MVAVVVVVGVVARAMEGNPMSASKKLRNTMIRFGMMNGLRPLTLGLALTVPMMSAAADQQTFATPKAAVDALITALRTNNDAALLAIMGEKHKELVVTGDPAADAVWRAHAVAQFETFNLLLERGDDHRVLLIGAEAWPVPIPLKRVDGSWRFATEEGVVELLNRRIGQNELNAISTLRALLDAQRQYAARDRDGDGVLAYAQKVMSTPGKHDGLYWPSDPAKDEEESPIGPLIAESSAYLVGHKAGDPYRGYRFRMLTGQGKNAAGGAYSYIINGRMIGGFAMVAFPDAYGEDGVMTFIVNHNGKVFEKNLGKDTASVGGKMTVFDPGTGWKEVSTELPGSPQ